MSYDPAIATLLDALEQFSQHKSAWIADEHPLAVSDLQSMKRRNCLLISNRFDQVALAQKECVEALFSDFNLDSLPKDISLFLFRLSKEKAVVHHVINRVSEQLPIGGRLCIAGYKQEGIKSTIEKSENRFGTKAQIERGKKQLLRAVLIKGELGELLDDRHYAQLRTATDRKGETFVTKPGLYGWEKVDQGSERLIAVLRSEYPTGIHGRVLDLGCGYGYLSIQAFHCGAREIVATDNCAAALLACEANFQRLAINDKCDFQVIPADVGESIAQQFDLILCNPPFHQGFSSERTLTHRFLRSIKNHLRRQGIAFIVVNEFIPVPQIAEEMGLGCNAMDRNSGFVVYRLTDS